MRVRRQKGAIVVSQSGFEAHAVGRLKQGGFRITLPRVQVVRALSLAERPLSAYGIHQEIIASGARVDVVSVYRILETLSQLGLVHHIGIVDGYMACRLDETHDEEAEHVVCSECGRVTELTMPDGVLRATNGQLVALGYRPKQTRVEILAVCPECSA
jgi:Fe2+ or Zn2+ uptake regulation protein